MELVTSRRKLSEIGLDWTNEVKEKYGLDDDAIVVRKGYIAKQGEDDIDDDERTITSYINTIAIDRDGEVVLPSGGILDDYLKHPVVLFGHNYRSLPIGKSLWIKKDKKGLISRTQYAPTEEAEKVYQYRKAGFPLAESIGFIPTAYIREGHKDWEKTIEKWRGEIAKVFGSEPKNNPHTIITKWLLLEYSDVSVPSNPEALEYAKTKNLIDPLVKSGVLMEEKPDVVEETEGETKEESDSDISNIATSGYVQVVGDTASNTSDNTLTWTTYTLEDPRIVALETEIASLKESNAHLVECVSTLMEAVGLSEKKVTITEEKITPDLIKKLVKEAMGKVDVNKTADDAVKRLKGKIS